jgi:putative FmdB family regulatory protein
MPIYEYECINCGNIEEAIQKFSDRPLTRCKLCSGKLNKLVSQSSFHLKGSGWYVTDYAGKSRPSPSNEKTSRPSDSSSTANKSKPNAKTEKKSTEK